MPPAHDSRRALQLTRYRFCYEAIACHIATVAERGKAIAASADGGELYANLDDLTAGGGAPPPLLPKKKK